MTPVAGPAMNVVDGGAGAYLFLLGLASGIALLTISAFRRVSPPWLRWLLIATGLLVVSRYAMMAASMTTALSRLLSGIWLVGLIGFTLPATFAVDHIIRHPAMTPRKLLRWYIPLPVVAGVAFMSGLGYLLVILQAVACLGLAGLCLMLLLKIPSPSIRRALLGLVLAYGYLGLSSLLIIFSLAVDLQLLPLDLLDLLWPEMVALIALWHAYETGTRLQREPASL